MQRCPHGHMVRHVLFSINSVPDPTQPQCGSLSVHCKQNMCWMKGLGMRLTNSKMTSLVPRLSPALLSWPHTFSSLGSRSTMQLRKQIWRGPGDKVLYKMTVKQHYCQQHTSLLSETNRKRIVFPNPVCGRPHVTLQTCLPWIQLQIAVPV